ncbi:Sec-independent protein translocase protein TatAy [compost metagenome]
MFGLGVPEIALIGGIALLVFGPKKLPALAASLGTGLREFRKGIKGIQEDIRQEDETSEGRT